MASYVIDQTLLETRQDSLLAYHDGVAVPAPVLRMGIMPLADKWDLFGLQGRMFTMFQGVLGTVVTGPAADNAGIVLTAPTIRFTVPTGLTVFPRRLQVALLLTATAIDNEIAVIYSQTDSYTSAVGGTAITPLNLRTDNPRATAVTNCYISDAGALLEGALTNVRALYQQCFPLDMVFGTSYNSDINIDVTWDDLHPIVGPASVLIYLSGKTATNTHYFNMSWAEVPTVSAVGAV